MDLDDVIIENAGKSIPEIFATDGETAFRKMERDMLRDIIASAERHSIPEAHSQPWEANTIVLALGGGAVMQEECEKMVHDCTICIYLKASVDTLLDHLEGQAAGRPLLNTASVMSSEVETSTKRAALKERILDLMAKRASTYERTAHHIIDTDNKSIEDIAAEICHLLNCQSAQ
jgi:shikimate kinase